MAAADVMAPGIAQQYGVHGGGKHPDQHHYWGPRDSLIDWCEENYVITPYVAEFYNTVSYFPTPFLMYIAMCHTWNHATHEKRFTYLFMSFILVAIGSCAFHATLRFHAQMLDEVPMLFTINALFYCLACNKYNTPKSKEIAYIGSFAFLTALELFVYTYLQWYLLFCVMFVSTVVAVIVEGYSLRKEYPRDFFLFKRSVLWYWSGKIMWTLDHFLCETIFSVIQFHAWWHIMVAFGTYMFFLFLIAIRGRELPDVLDVQFKVVTYFKFVPLPVVEYLRRPPKSPNTSF